jgi:hypothetical protein
VEPHEGFGHADVEMYLAQGEIYTKWPLHSKSPDLKTGHQIYSPEHEHLGLPEYVVFNGAHNAFYLGTGGKPIGPVLAGQNVRLFVADGGPNLMSTFHVIGEMFDKVYTFADVTSPPNENVQSALVIPGACAIAEMYIDVPGIYVIVDHALTRTFDLGLVGMILALDPKAAQTYTIPQDILNPATRAGVLKTYSDKYQEIYYGACDSRTANPEVKAMLGTRKCSSALVHDWLKAKLQQNSTTLPTGTVQKWWPNVDDNRNSGRYGQDTPTANLCSLSRETGNPPRCAPDAATYF